MPTATRTKRSSGSDSKPKRTKTAAHGSGNGSAKASSDRAAAITNYTTAQRWLFEHIDHERQRRVKYDDQTFSLDRMRKLLDLLGNPHEQLRCVQVAGTKGKGSTCAMLASMLEACGYTVGLYSSPHLIDLRERITIDRQMISYNDAATVFKEIAAVEGKLKDGPPTFFEIMTAAALKHFAEQAVDVAVLETGLGGRLDSVTAVNPLVVGITKIGLDHMHLLGDTVEQIAREKAGVFKPGVPAISVAQDNKVVAVLKEEAEKVGCPLMFTGKDIEFSYRFEASRELGPHTRVGVTTELSHFEHLAVPLKGEHQAHNCGLALALLDRLKHEDFTLPEPRVIEGLASTELHGRMEQVWSRPRVIIDGAHNPDSLEALIRALGAHVSYDSLVLIFGCGEDKDVNAMLKQIALGADKVIFTRAKANPRALEPQDLIHRFSDVSGKMAQTAPRLTDALQLAGRAVGREDLVVITGSFYLAGEARKYFLDKKAKAKKSATAAN